MNRFSHIVISFLLAMGAMLPVAAQPARTMVQVSVAPRDGSFYHKVGDKVDFDVRVTMSGVPTECSSVEYEVMEDMMPAHARGELTLKNGEAVVRGGTMRQPGFLRCKVVAVHDGTRYEGLCTVAFDAQALQPLVEMPADFQDFWANQLTEAQQVPISPRLELIPESCTDRVDVYHLSLGAFRNGVRVYGILCLPKAPGRYPAILKVPGAGVHKFMGDVNTASNGYITLEIGIHGIPVNQSQAVYDALAWGALNNYPSANIDSRYDYYYRRVYLSCVRAVDYLTSLPQYDGENMFVAGGSQGGALSIVTAALNPKVKAIMALYPALCDMTAYLHGRAGGWPHYFRDRKDDAALAAKVSTAAYYDVANFARLLKVPCYMSFGFNDTTCPPTTTYATYNAVPSEKKLVVVEETGHYNYPEQWNVGWDWMMSFRK